MVAEVCEVGHGELLEGNSPAPVAIEDAVDDVALGVGGSPEILVDLAELLDGVGRGVEIVFLILLFPFPVAGQVGHACRQIAVLEPFEGEGDERVSGKAGQRPDQGAGGGGNLAPGGKGRMGGHADGCSRRRAGKHCDCASASLFT